MIDDRLKDASKNLTQLPTTRKLSKMLNQLTRPSTTPTQLLVAEKEIEPAELATSANFDDFST